MVLEGYKGKQLISLNKLVSAARRYREIMRLIDRDGEGHISADELGNSLGALFGWRPTRYEAQRMLCAVNPDSQPFVNLRQFITLFTTDMPANPALAKIKVALQGLHEMFQIFVVDAPGLTIDYAITHVELGKVLTATGRVYTDEEIRGYFDKIDVDGSGSMSFVEFGDIMTASKASGDQHQVRHVINTAVTELRGMFELFDVDGGGEMTMTELQNLLLRLGRRPTLAEMAEMVGRPGEGDWLDFNKFSFDFSGFVNLIAGSQTKAQRRLRHTLREFREIFELFDETGDGDLTADEFLDVMKLFGTDNSLNEEKVKRLVRQFSMEDGSMDFFSFLSMMASGNPEVESLIKTQIVGFRESFRIFDLDGEGSVSFDEFVEAWQEFGFESPEHEVRAMLESQDEDGDGMIGFTEFVHMLSPHTLTGSSNIGEQIRATLAELRATWSQLDSNGDGTLSCTEIENALRRGGVDVTAEDVEYAMACQDESGDGVLDFQEFMQLMGELRLVPALIVGPLSQCFEFETLDVKPIQT